MGRYEDYNEMLYEAYCKAAIDNAILKARQKKAAHGQLVASLSDLSDADLLSLADKWEPELPDDFFTYHIQGQTIQIKDQKLGQALSSLLPGTVRSSCSTTSWACGTRPWQSGST